MVAVLVPDDRNVISHLPTACFENIWNVALNYEGKLVKMIQGNMQGAAGFVLSKNTKLNNGFPQNANVMV